MTVTRELFKILSGHGFLHKMLLWPWHLTNWPRNLLGSFTDHDPSFYQVEWLSLINFLRYWANMVFALNATVTLTFELLTSKCIGDMMWLTDGRTDGLPHRWTFVGYFFCLKLPNKQKLPNKRLTEWMESSHRWTFVGYFCTQQVPFCLPGRTDGRLSRRTDERKDAIP